MLSHLPVGRGVGALGLGLLFVLALCADASAQPPGVANFELVSITAPASGQEGASGSLRTAFAAYGRTFDLELEPNDLFASGAVDMWVGARDRVTTTPSVAPFYKGRVRGDSRSWVRVSVRDGVLDGLIRTKDDVFVVEPASRFFGGPAPEPMVMYRWSEAQSPWEQWSCGTEESAEPFGTHLGHLLDRPQSAEAAATRLLKIGIIADYEYFQEHGNASAADMQSIINQVDGIYREEVGTAIQVSHTACIRPPEIRSARRSNPISSCWNCPPIETTRAPRPFRWAGASFHQSRSAG